MLIKGKLEGEEGKGSEGTADDHGQTYDVDDFVAGLAEKYTML